MKTQSFILLILLFLISSFTALNWNMVNTPSELSFGFMSASLPLGLVFLGFIITLIVLFLVFILTIQASTLLSTRRQTKAMQEKQNLADKAEASRFTDLRQYLELEFKQHVTQNIDLNSKLLNKLEEMETAIKDRS